MTHESSHDSEAMRSAQEAHQAALAATEATERAQDAVERAVREGIVPGSAEATDMALPDEVSFSPPFRTADPADREAFRGADQLGEMGVDEGRL